METLETRYTSTSKALEQLKKSLDTIQENKYPELYEQLRDSLIKRFEFSFDTMWKYLKEYLKEIRKTEVQYPSPNRVFRKSYEQKLISEQKLNILLDATTDRNLTSHTYNEKLAEQISKRISEYYDTMKSIIDKLES